MNDKKYILATKSSETDTLSEILQLLNLDVDIYHNAKVCGDWRINEHRLGATCFHIVTEGNCRMHVSDNAPVILNRGDLVIFPRELTHHILPMEMMSGEQQHLSFKQAESLSGTGLLCGEVIFKHDGSRFLLDALPAYFVIENSTASHWLSGLLDLIVYESINDQPASQSIINRLSELLFTYALRQYLSVHPDQSGMLAIYGDYRLAKAVQSIHQSPQNNWTLESLAKEAGLSRTVFTETFKAVSGWTPGQYLIWWRMQLAWSLLDKGGSVSQVAEKVGYKSESSFSRAFTKTFSVSAGKVRRGNH